INDAALFNDIYVSALEEMYEKYNLPALQVWEDGYVQGEATNDECATLVENGLAKKDEEGGYTFMKLDSELCSLIEAKAKEIAKKKLKIYRLHNHDNISDTTKPIFESYDVEEYNKDFGTNYQTADEASADDPEYLFTYDEMLEFL